NRGVPLQKIDGDAGCRIIVFAESNIIHIHEKSSLLHVTASIDGKNGPVNIEIYKQRLFYTIPETEYVIFFPKRSFQRDHSGSILPEQWEKDKEEMDEGEQETEKKVYGYGAPAKGAGKGAVGRTESGRESGTAELRLYFQRGGDGPGEDQRADVMRNW